MTADLKLQESICCKSTKVVGIAADHGGHELKEYLTKMLREAGAEVIDFGDHQLVPENDYPDFVVPLAQAVAAGKVDRGVAICGSGVGASIVANKVNGARACLINDTFSAHQGVEDDDLNIICLGGLVVGHALAWELVRTFLIARFSGEERHRRRLGKLSELEKCHFPKAITTADSVEGDPANRDSPLKVYLVRHGETEWTLTGQHTGLTDIPLTSHGEDEVREWGKRFQSIPFSHVLTSPRRRATHTCTLLGLHKVAEIEEDLAEWDYGDYEGMKSVTIREDRPGWNVYRDGCPNGESPDQISDRADRLIAHLRMLHGNVALFSHGQFGAVLAARWIELSVQDAQHFSLGTATLGILGHNPHHPEVPVIELWNSTPRVASPHNNTRHATTNEQIQDWENEGGDILNDEPNTPLNSPSPEIQC